MSGTVFKLGKRPARPGAVGFHFRKYALIPEMTEPPATFGHETSITTWGMLGNDQVGDCYIAGAMHEEMLWNAETRTPVTFSTQTAIGYYSELTGYNPCDEQADGSNPTDQGTDVPDALKHRKSVGVPDDSGKRHRIGAYVALKPGDINELRYAAYYFDGVGIGVNFPQQWMDAFNNGQPWDAVTDPNYAGGHYIPCVGFNNGNPIIVTWGKPIEMTAAGYQQNCDEVYAYLTVEKLVNGVDARGLNLTQLQADLKRLTKL